ncbi:MAG: hypothetical protein K0U74_08075 [Alphaproteobacteria bacterium]|nr:hypothetical protein [Alphaproteobacteria bacterium]
MERFIIEAALLMLAAYFLGAVLGCLCRRLFTSDKKRAVPAGSTTRTAAPAAAAAPASVREAPEPVQPKIETVSNPTPPQDAKIAESARFERVLTTAPASASEQPAPREPEPAPPQDNPNAGTAASAVGAAAAAAAAAVAASTVARSTSTPQQTEARPAPETRLPSSSGSSGIATVTAAAATGTSPPADDLTRIRGIDAQTARQLNQLGYTNYAQIADWKKDDVSRLGGAFGDNRVLRGSWIEQAKILAAGNETSHIRTVTGKSRASDWSLVSNIAPAAVAAAAAATAAATVSAAPAAAAPADDLSRIRGIDAGAEKILSANGIRNYSQIAAWTAPDIHRLDDQLASKGRISRQNWVEQAMILAAGKQTAHVRNLTGKSRASDWSLVSTVVPAAAAAAAAAATIAAVPAAAKAAQTPDDLSNIRGIDSNAETVLTSNGVASYSQIAGWTATDVQRFDGLLGTPGRISRENWIEQAKVLAGGKETSFLKRQKSYPAMAAAPAVGLLPATPLPATTPPAPTSAVAPQPAAAGPDDLRSIRGIGPAAEKLLTANGITSFSQIAGWTSADVQRFDGLLGGTRRVSPQNWIEQAKVLADGKETSFLKRQKSYPAVVAAPATGLLPAEPIPASTTTAAVTPQAPTSADTGGAATAAAAVAATAAAAAATAATSAATDSEATTMPAVPDDLKKIEGIDAATEELLNSKGVSRYAQIAGWATGHVQKVDQLLGTPGRVSEQNWIEQAKVLADGKQTAFSRGAARARRRDKSPAPPVAVRRAPDGDDLTRIGGIDAGAEKFLRSKGVTTFRQIANWTPAHEEKVGSLLSQPGRVEKERWIEQAKLLVAGKDPAAALSESPATGVASTAAAAAAGIAATTAAAAATAHTDSTAATPASPPASSTPPVPSDTASARPARLADAIRQNTVEIGAGKSTSGSGVAGMRSVRSQLLSGQPAASAGATDDLKKIRGIGVLIEKKLNAMGVKSYEDIAQWSASDIERISRALDFKGRIQREGWVQQARILSSGGQTEFSKRIT